MILYDYVRSTACYRVRIALKVKKLTYECVEVHLLNKGGTQNSLEYRGVNPQGLVPTLDIDGQKFTQSLSIIEYLDELYPEIPLLPEDPTQKAKVRSLALMVACDIHPLNNLRVLNQLKSQFHAQEEDIRQWYHVWLKAGFDAFETQLSYLNRTKPFCLGHSLTLADVCLIPQVFNANRFHFPMDEYPLINAINEHCLSIEAFKF